MRSFWPLRVEVEGVDVECLAGAVEGGPRDQEVHLQGIEARVPLEPADPVAAIGERDRDLVLGDL